MGCGKQLHCIRGVAISGQRLHSHCIHAALIDVVTAVVATVVATVAATVVAAVVATSVAAAAADIVATVSVCVIVAAAPGFVHSCHGRGLQLIAMDATVLTNQCNFKLHHN